MMEFRGNAPTIQKVLEEQSCIQKHTERQWHRVGKKGFLFEFQKEEKDNHARRNAMQNATDTQKTLLLSSFFLSSASSGPLDDFQCQHDKYKSAGQNPVILISIFEECKLTIKNIPDNITLHQQLGHDAHENIVELADLCELESARCAGEQEADNDKDGVVEDANGDVFGKDGEHGCHEQSGQEHAADKSSDEQVALFLFAFGGCGEFFLGQGVAGEVGAEDNQDQRNSHTAALADGAGD